MKVYDIALVLVSGLLPIPAQTWDSQPTIANQSMNKGTGGTDAVVELKEDQPNPMASIEAGRTDGQQEDSSRQVEDEDEETVVIRRVGFVFLAYNVEFW
jgi:hypothetical protein